MKALDIAAAAFKAQCLKLLDDVAATGRPLTITKRGRPVARLVPIPGPQALFGAMKGSVLAQRDIVSPVGENWESAT